jgi:hypothetical protein
MTKVKVLKPHQGPTGFVNAGDMIEVDPQRHQALARNGLVAPPEGENTEARKPAGVVSHGGQKPRQTKIVQTKSDDVSTKPVQVKSDDPAPSKEA